MAGALKRNPLLLAFSFDENLRQFKIFSKPNPLIIDFNDFLKTHQSVVKFIAIYQYYMEISPIIKKTNPSKNEIFRFGTFIRKLYYTNPLLGRSIFEMAKHVFSNAGYKETADYLLASYHKLNPQYDF